MDNISVAGLRDEVIAWRHYFHQNPELGLQEEKTSQKIAELLKGFGLEVHSGINKTGVVGILKNGDSDRTIALRTDIDALPIQEPNSLPFASQNPGVMHACGHDGHTAILLGAAKYLSETRNFNGTVCFIFQPAEETLDGAKAMLDDGLLDRFPFSAIFAMHNAAGIEEGKVAIRPGTILASGDRLEITITGHEGHAGFPPKNQAILTLGKLIPKINAIPASPDFDKPPILSLTQVHAGNNFNIIPGEVALGGSLRCSSEESRQKALSMLEAVLVEVCDEHGVSYKFERRRSCPVLVNTPKESQAVEQAAVELFGKANVITDDQIVMACDDFAYFLQKTAGAYLSIGNGVENGRVHTRDYRFNDNILISGIRLWVNLVERCL